MQRKFSSNPIWLLQVLYDLGGGGGGGVIPTSFRKQRFS